MLVVPRRFLRALARARSELLSFLGLSVVSVGAALVYVPAGVILFGVTLVITAVAMGDGR